MQDIIDAVDELKERLNSDDSIVQGDKSLLLPVIDMVAYLLSDVRRLATAAEEVARPSHDELQSRFEAIARSHPAVKAGGDVLDRLGLETAKLEALTDRVARLEDRLVTLDDALAKYFADIQTATTIQWRLDRIEEWMAKQPQNWSQS